MPEDIRNLFAEIRETQEGFKSDCPSCGRKDKFWFNEEKRVGCCFEAGCKFHYSNGGCTEYRLRAYLRKEGIRYVTPVVVKQSFQDNALPEEFRILDELEEPVRNTIYAYLNSRGLHSKTLQRQKVGYCETGKYWGYIIFPVFSAEGKVIYWQGRRFKDRKQKFFNPPCSNKKEIFYQLGGSQMTKRIIVVESVINALTLDAGKTLSRTAIMARSPLPLSVSRFGD